MTCLEIKNRIIKSKFSKTKELRNASNCNIKMVKIAPSLYTYKKVAFTGGTSDALVRKALANIGT